MTAPVIRVGLIYGSVRTGRICDVIADWTRRQLTVQDTVYPVTIDPACEALKPILWGDDDAIIRLRKTLRTCDAFVILAPEYNHSFSGPLKTVLDSATEEWANKPVAIISYGGISSGARAAAQLRPVLHQLGLIPLNDSVSFESPWEMLDDYGVLQDVNSQTQQSMTRTVATLLRWHQLLSSPIQQADSEPSKTTLAVESRIKEHALIRTP